VEEIKKEIQDAFHASSQAKCLPHPSDGNDDDISDFRDRYRQIQQRHQENFCLVTTSLPLVLLPLFVATHCLLSNRFTDTKSWSKFWTISNNKGFSASFHINPGVLLHEP